MRPTASAALLGSWRQRQLHIIASGVHPLLPGLKQPVAGLGQGRALVQVADEFEDVLALKVAARGDAIGGHEGIRFLAQDRADLVRRPDKELAFHAFAVGVLRAVEGNT
jgi:hypothetical protein